MKKEKKYIIGGFFKVTYIHFGNIIMGYITQSKRRNDADRNKVNESCIREEWKIERLDIPKGFYLAITHETVISKIKQLNKETKIIIKIPLGKGNINGLKKYIKTNKCKFCKKKKSCENHLFKNQDKVDEYIIIIKQKK